MRYDYNGFWSCDSSCEIEVHRRSDGKSFLLARIEKPSEARLQPFAPCESTVSVNAEQPVAGEA
jgi:hypothetical protein